jgi:hypothetical protein
MPFGGETLTPSSMKIFGVAIRARLPCGDSPGRRCSRWINESLGMNICRAMIPVLNAAVLASIFMVTRFLFSRVHLNHLPCAPDSGPKQ